MFRVHARLAAAAAFGLGGIHNSGYAESWLPQFLWKTDDAREDFHHSLSGSSGRLFIWGGPRFGRRPREIVGLSNVKKAAVTDDVCVALTAEGAVIVVEPDAGERDVEGGSELTRSNGASASIRREARITRLQTPVGRAEDVAVRGDGSQIVVADTSGLVCVIARETRSDGDTAARIASYAPGRILRGALKRAHVRKVRCGYRHCVAIADDGSAYAWGDNYSKQLGLGDSQTAHTASNEAPSDTEGDCGIIDVPARVIMPKNVRVRDAGCGDRHTVFLGDDESVYAVGDGRWAQLGVTAEPWRDGGGDVNGDVRRAACLGDLAICDVACGAGHTATLVKDGTVVSFGENSFGQLGHHNLSSFAPPSPIANITLRAVAVSSGRNHTCLVTDQGEVHCIGDGVAGQLGAGPLQRTGVWRRVKTLADATAGAGHHVSFLTAGGNTTAAIVASGTAKESL